VRSNVRCWKIDEGHMKIIYIILENIFKTEIKVLKAEL
jgi:hypothetical protein